MLVPHGKEREAARVVLSIDVAPVRNGVKRETTLKRYRFVAHNA